MCNKNDDKTAQENTEIGRHMEMVESSGSVTTDNGHYRIHCMTIVGQIEGHYVLPSDTKSTKYEHMIPQLVAVDESEEIDGLLLLLNTVGGVDCGDEEAYCFAGFGRWPFHRGALGGGGESILYCPFGYHDHSSGAH